jgi:hypothetical protein
MLAVVLFVTEKHDQTPQCKNYSQAAAKFTHD